MSTKDELEAIALAALRDVASDKRAPAAARAAASRTLLEHAGAIGRLQTLGDRTKKPLSEMSAGELRSEIERLQATRRAEPEPDPFGPDEGEASDPFGPAETERPEP
jgi:hypothetical protein